MSEVVDIHKKKGKRPEFDVYIGRRICRHHDFQKSSKWANPHLSLEEYEEYIRRKIKRNPKYFNLDELKGKKLGCWCVNTNKIEPLICHGQVLMKLIREKENEKINSKS